MKVFFKIRLAFRLWLLRRLPPCDQLAPVMSESMDHQLSLRKGLILRLHLFVCLRCARYLRQLHLLRDALRTKSSSLLNETSPEPSAGENSLTDEARARIKRALNSRENG